MKKLVSLLLALVLSLGLVSAALAEGPVQLKIATWTSNEAQLELLGTFVKEFAEQKGAAIDVTFESIDFAEYNTKLLLELQGNAAPDAYWVLETSAPAFVASGLLATLDDALAAYNPEDLSDGAMELWRKDGATYAVPFSTSPFFMLYNADLFEQAGVKTPEEQVAEGAWTWESFREAAKAIHDATGVWGYVTVDTQGYDARILHNLVPIIRANGGDVWDAEGNVKIAEPEAVEAVQFFHDMLYVDQSVVPPGDESNFYAGGAAMTVGQISRVSNLKDVEWKWGLAPMPSGKAGSVPVIGQAGLGAFANGANVELAKELVAYMTSESCVARMAGIWPPARISVMESEAFLSSNPMVTPEQMKAAVADSITTGRVLPAHVNYPQMEVEAKIIFDKLWNAGADVQAVLTEVAAVYSNYMQ
ncbi:MAG: sugar ABC transporter substrate-binding protein [Candidatus Limiplasma sp.]|nr:sugar ABC transporter substrate-binding protein [Candidatus Limiplasma sp.]